MRGPRPYPLGRRADAVRLYYALTAVSTVCFSLVSTVSVVYMATVVGLDPLQLVLVGTVLELSCFCFEVPTGLLADLRSRRLSVILGFALVGVGFVLQGAVASFGALLLAQVVWGLGFTFTSGATQAWLVDEVEGAAGPDPTPAEVGPILTRGAQISMGAAFVGTAGAGALALIALSVPMIAGGIGLLVLAIVLAFVMPEAHFSPTPAADRSTFGRLLDTARTGFVVARRRPVVRGLVLINLVVGLASEAFDRLWQLRIIDTFGLRHPGTGLPIDGQQAIALFFTAVALVGLVISLLVSLVLNAIAHRRLSVRPDQTLALLAGVQAVGVAVVGLGGALPLVLGSLWAKDAAAALARPVEAAWFNRQLDSDHRATVLSFHGQANAIGQVVGGPPLGALGRATSASVAIAAAAVITATTVFGYGRLRAQKVDLVEPGAR